MEAGADFADGVMGIQTGEERIGSAIATFGELSSCEDVSDATRHCPRTRSAAARAVAARKAAAATTSRSSLQSD